jgi:AcrR family transcriptional regulator
LRPARARPLRADARRNRERVLEVAQAVFAGEGLGVPIDEIARRAGLGVGTLYRHFPTKEALFAAIVVGRIERVTVRAVELAHAEPAGEVFFGFLGELIAQGEEKKDFVAALAGAGVDLERTTAACKRAFRAALAALLARAQAAGAVRDDVQLDDILSVVAGLFAAIERHPAGSRARDRLLALACDGLRPPRGAAPR